MIQQRVTDDYISPPPLPERTELNLMLQEMEMNRTDFDQVDFEVQNQMKEDAYREDQVTMMMCSWEPLSAEFHTQLALPDEWIEIMSDSATCRRMYILGEDDWYTHGM